LEVHDFLAGLVVLIGLIGIVVVILPGLVLQVLAVGIWALEEASAEGWVVFGLVSAIAIAASVLKYLSP
jgi:uncharacterized protein